MMDNAVHAIRRNEADSDACAPVFHSSDSPEEH